MAVETKPASILIVDDTPSNVLLLERMLTERGYRTRSVLSGKLALAAARAELPDLILLDINMPAMTGYDVCGHFKNDPALKAIPVIFISGLQETIDRVVAFRVGGIDFVTKPFQLEEVLARIQTHLKLRGLEKLRDNLGDMCATDLQRGLVILSELLDGLDERIGEKLSGNSHDQIVAARRHAIDLMSVIARMGDMLEPGTATHPRRVLSS